MYLTPDEERAYDGEYGWAYQVSMKILVSLGDLYGATRLIPINSAHISGVSYKTMGDAPIDFLQALASEGGRARVPSTANPSGFDQDYLSEITISRDYIEKQLRIIELYKRMGVDPILTCTPYYQHKPRPSWHLAWAESSAVIYANSVLGSWTNREGGPSALAGALVGKVPEFGMHKAESRQANIRIKLESNPMNEIEFGALGIYAGKLLKDRIPLFEGLSNYTSDDLKQLGAAMASSGMLPLFHYYKPYRRSELEAISIEEGDIKNIIESLSTSSETPNLIFIGCPHCSLDEIRGIAQILRGKKVKEDVKLWVCTSRYVKEKAKAYVNIIEDTGGHVLCDTCAIVTWIRKLGIDVMMTNSAKTAYYAPTLNKVDVILAPLSNCVKAACKY